MYSTAVLATGGGEKVMANWFALSLEPEVIGGADDPVKKKPWKRQLAKRALAIEPESKKSKASGTATGSAGGPWCPIHRTSQHDLKDCRSVQSLAGGKQKAWVDAKKEGAGGGCFRCGKPGHFICDCPSRGGGGHVRGQAGRGTGRNDRGGRNRPSRGRDDHGDEANFGASEDDEEGEAGGQYQEAHGMACVDGCAFALPSHAAFKRLSREVNAIQPSAKAQRPLKWSAVPLTF